MAIAKAGQKPSPATCATAEAYECARPGEAELG